jgi:hypothetical protein
MSLVFSSPVRNCLRGRGNRQSLVSTDFENEPGPDIQAAAERHLELVWAAHYAQEDAEDGVIIPSPAAGLFCGCETCVVREIIAGAWPRIEEYFALRLSR